jgi:hypothetical protein
MVLYARADILRQSAIPGGCGFPHTRPVKKGPDGEDIPIPVWGIDCPPCEAHLNDDVRWAKLRSKIPLTPDQTEELQDQKVQAEAALRSQQLFMAQQAIEAQMAQRGTIPDIDPTDMAITKSEVGGSSPEAAGTPSEPAAPASVAGDYGALTKNDLKDLARERNLPIGGTKDDLIARHLEHDASQ